MPSIKFSYALDEDHNRLFVGCRSPAMLRMISMETGKDICSVRCSGDADDIFYKDSLVFVSAGKGFIDVFRAKDRELLQINHVETRKGARTSLLVAIWDKTVSCCACIIRTNRQLYGFITLITNVTEVFP